MTEKIENLVLEQLRAIRTDMGRMADDIRAIRTEMTSIRLPSAVSRSNRTGTMTILPH